MFIPLRRNGKLYRPAATNAYGEKTYQTTFVTFGWAPVYRRDMQSPSPVRADSSASKGRADLDDHDWRLVVDKFVTPLRGDKIEVDGVILEIVRVQQRMDIVGRLHHWEVDGATI